MLCLDESMSIWFQRWTCPGWVFCPRKPHPFGNEYHTACCGLSGVLFSMEMVEGKDRPRQLGPQEFDDEGGKTCGLLLRLLKPVFHTGRYVVLDSGFCVLKAIVALKKKGVFAGALIKKRRYWPTHVPGQHILEYFNDRIVGSVDAVSGLLDDVKYTIWCMKEPDYVMQIMATGGALCTVGGKEVKQVYTDSNNQVKTTSFHYAKPFEWHFRYRHAVDDHNNLRHAVPSIEGTFLTSRLPLRVFSFLVAVTEINAYLIVKYFIYKNDPKNLPKLLNFRRELAWQMIESFCDHSEPQQDEGAASRDAYEVHKHCPAPHYARYYNGRVWVLGARDKYQQYKCRGIGCKKCTCSYCACTPAVWLCCHCHVKHCIDCVWET